jgi:hypothetical protein
MKWLLRLLMHLFPPTLPAPDSYRIRKAERRARMKELQRKAFEGH